MVNCLLIFFNLVTEDKIEDFLKHSIDIRFNCSTSDYLAKFDCKTNWGVDREIAKKHLQKKKKVKVRGSILFS